MRQNDGLTTGFIDKMACLDKKRSSFIADISL